jgi:hypothetical protein
VYFSNVQQKSFSIKSYEHSFSGSVNNIVKVSVKCTGGRTEGFNRRFAGEE